MPKDAKLPPQVKKGDIIRASDMSRVFALLKRHEQPANSFSTGAFTVSRPVNKNETLTKVAVTSTVNAATWDSANNKLTPTELTARLWGSHSEGDGKQELLDETVDLVFYYPDAIPVSSGKMRVGYASGDELIIVSCTEIDQPE